MSHTNTATATLPAIENFSHWTHMQNKTASALAGFRSSQKCRNSKIETRSTGTPRLHLLLR